MLFRWGVQVVSVILAFGTPLALWFRFRWGSKSQVSFRQLPDPRERKWSYGRTEDIEIWSNYVHVIGINRGWWTGVIWSIGLEQVSFDSGQTVNASNEVIKTEIETYNESESERLDLGNPHQREERNIPGRDIAHVKFVPFIETGGKLAHHAEKSKEAEFTFKVTIEDNKRSNVVPCSVTMDVSDVSFE
jgi:hypothetical protein